MHSSLGTQLSVPGVCGHLLLLESGGGVGYISGSEQSRRKGDGGGMGGWGVTLALMEPNG